MGFYVAWAIVFALLIATWVRFLPTYEDLCELSPVGRPLMRLARWAVRPLRRPADRAIALIAPQLKSLFEIRSPWAGWDTPERAPEGIAQRTAALGRIHQMNGEGGGLALAAIDATDGALSVEDAAGAGMRLGLGVVAVVAAT